MCTYPFIIYLVVSTCHGKISKRGMDYWRGSKVVETDDICLSKEKLS